MPGIFMFVLMGLFGFLMFVTIIGSICLGSRAMDQARQAQAQIYDQSQLYYNYVNGQNGENRYPLGHQNGYVAPSYGGQLRNNMSSNADE